MYQNRLQFHLANEIKEVFVIAVTQEIVTDAIYLTVKKADKEKK
jgi:hypothetical protein